MAKVKETKAEREARLAKRRAYDKARREAIRKGLHVVKHRKPKAAPPPAQEPAQEPEVAKPGPLPGQDRPGPSLLDEVAALREQYQSLQEPANDARTEPPQAPPQEPGQGQAQAPAVPFPAADQPVVVSGFLLLTIVDALAPVLIVALLRLLKRKDVQRADLKLTADERESLEPFADRAAGVLMGNVSPVNAFLLALGAIYAAKIPAREPMRLA